MKKKSFCLRFKVDLKLFRVGRAAAAYLYESENKANSAQLELELGLSLAINK